MSFVDGRASRCPGAMPGFHSNSPNCRQIQVPDQSAMLHLLLGVACACACACDCVNANCICGNRYTELRQGASKVKVPHLWLEAKCPLEVVDLMSTQHRPFTLTVLTLTEP